MKDLISVIVPVYNVAAYLPECVESLLNQDYTAIEVILIDDGSTDKSGAICDSYAAKDARVKVLHQKNAGAAAAKNAGLRIAAGEFLSFVDSDDYLEPGAYRYMVALMLENQADVVRCSFRNVFRNRVEPHVYEPGRSVVEGKEFLRRFATDWTCGLLWNKLYRRELFQDVFFELGHKIDDEYFTYQGIMNAGKVVLDDRIIYNYRKRASSVMKSPGSQLQISIDRIDFMEKRKNNVIARFPDLRKDFDIAFIDALTYLPDYPDNCEESIHAYREYGKRYLLERGNTFPPRYLLRGLLRLYLTPVNKQLENAQRNKKPDSDEYYA